MAESGVLSIKQQLYASATDEITARIGYRDHALISYIVATGGYFGFMLTQHYGEGPEKIDIGYALVLMLPLPFLCLSFTLIILQHHLVIGFESQYLTREWFTTIDTADRAGLIGYENSAILRENNELLMVYRHYSQLITLCLPLAYSVIFLFRFYPSANVADRVLIGFECGGEVMVAAGIWFLHERALASRRQQVGHQR